jgi:hypothetical protein
MLIYRIEDFAGGGIYRGENLHLNPISSFSSERHPLPWSDSLFVENGDAMMYREGEPHYRELSTFIDGDFIFGFATTEQLRNWVYQDDWLWKFDERGFRLTVFDVPNDHVIVGYTQAVFRRREAVSESYFKLCDFFNIDTTYMDEDE